MAKRTRNQGRMAIGIDMGDKHSQICVLDAASGECVEEGRVPTTPAAFERKFGAMAPSRIAIEAGTHSPWANRLLEEAGHEVIVANPRRVRLISENHQKNDRVDADLLARLARADPKLLAPIEPRSEQAQVDRATLQARDGLVRSRTRLVNEVRGAVKSYGARIPKCSTEAFPATASPAIPAPLRAALQPVLDMIEQLTSTIRGYDRQIQQIAVARYPATARLQQISGVGPITALAFVVTIGDPSRFKKSRSVGAYLGLRPRQQESGESAPELRISKTGDAFMRRLLVQSAQYGLGPFGEACDLREWGLKLAARGGKNAKKRAVTATARKLAVLLHRLWVTGADYIPIRAEAQKKGTEAHAQLRRA